MVRGESPPLHGRTSNFKKIDLLPTGGIEWKAMVNLDWGCNVVHYLRICRLLARGIDRGDVSVYGQRDVRHALVGRWHHVAVVARTSIPPQLADGKMDG